MKIKDYLKENILLFDGAMGSYVKELKQTNIKSELLNITDAQLIRNIHESYLISGARAIKTNTFSANKNRFVNYGEIINRAVCLANEMAEKYDAYVFGNIGPDIDNEYLDTVKVMMNAGVENYLFETLISAKGLKEAAEYIKKNNPDSYIIVSFTINSDGYTKDGEFFIDLLSKVDSCEYIDSIGLNCSTGPYYLKENLKYFPNTDKAIYISPNASYPFIINNRSVYQNNTEYYTSEMMDIVNLGANIIGGCCGTNPENIRNIAIKLRDTRKVDFRYQTLQQKNYLLNNPFMTKLSKGKKVIAVELDSPKNDDISDFIDSAKTLKSAGIDLMTIADNPLGYVRMSSSIMACKIKRELNMDVMPHLTCRDRNINATKSLLMGLTTENISNVLIITGDPLPTPFVNEVKSVYEFNSRKLAKYITNLNKTDFNNSFNIMGALNVNAVNFDIQLKLAKEKIDNGVTVLLTQPLLNDKAIENFKKAKGELNTRILAGIMPVVSYRNALFINNEIPGIDIDEDIVSLYENLGKNEAEDLAFRLSADYIKEVYDYADGFYLMTPFNRVDLIIRIVNFINEHPNEK